MKTITNESTLPKEMEQQWRKSPSILAPLGSFLNPFKSKNILTQTDLKKVKKGSQLLSKNQLLLSILRDKLYYISHPSVSSLECSINLSMCEMFSHSAFEDTVQEILTLANFNPKQIELKEKNFTLLFKEVAAIKLLNLLFKDNSDHALYPIYLKWIDGSEWMKINY